MLVEFHVENFRSFRERATLSMVATNIVSQPPSLDEHNVFEVNEVRLLSSAVVYGANASGKSNLVKALQFARNFVLYSSLWSIARANTGVEPFLLNRATQTSPSTFEFIFFVQKTQYRYGFALTRDQIEEEWLYRMGSRREMRLFGRNRQTIKISERSFREGRDLEERTHPRTLFLSVVAQFNGIIAQSIIRWFRRMEINTGIEAMHDRFRAMMIDEAPYHTAIQTLITQFDVGIEALSIERSPATLPSDLPSQIAQQLQALFTDTQQTNNPPEQINIQTQHSVYDDQQNIVGTTTFDLERQESAGTQRLFEISPAIIRALREGFIVVVDELDARIHPNLATALVQLFTNPQTNPHHAQLIFTTHNTNLLGEALFRRDQVWFVEKGVQGGSRLYSLVEYLVDGKGVRNDAALEKNYLLGRYGAVPLPGDLAAAIHLTDAETESA